MEKQKTSLRWLCLLTGVFIVLVAGMVIWFDAMNEAPSISIPTPKMPSPNAYDYYTAAANAIVDSEKIYWAYTNPTAKTVQPKSFRDPDYRSYTIEEKEDLVRRNAGALQKMKQGLAYTYLQPPVPSMDYAKFRALNKLILLESQTKVAKGDWKRAMNGYLDGMQLGVDISRGADVIGMGNSDLCQAFSRRQAWTTLEHLDSVQSAAAARRMETIILHQASLAQILEYTKWCDLATMRDVFQSSGWRSYFGSMLDSTKSSSSNVLLHIRLMTCSKRSIVHNYSEQMDWCISKASLPYAAMIPVYSAPPDPYNFNILTILQQERFIACCLNTQNSLLAVSFALHAYKLRQGHYPDTLEELVPGYLSKLPFDPFALKGTFRYRRTGSKYILYSIGPDGKDDDGKEICDTKMLEHGLERARLVESDSKGDIVAGVNIYYP